MLSPLRLIRRLKKKLHGNKPNSPSNKLSNRRSNHDGKPRLSQTSKRQLHSASSLSRQRKSRSTKTKAPPT